MTSPTRRRRSCTGFLRRPHAQKRRRRLLSVPRVAAIAAAAIGRRARAPCARRRDEPVRPARPARRIRRRRSTACSSAKGAEGALRRRSEERRNAQAQRHGAYGSPGLVARTAALLAVREGGEGRRDERVHDVAERHAPQLIMERRLFARLVGRRHAHLRPARHVHGARRMRVQRRGHERRLLGGARRDRRPPGRATTTTT